MRYKTLPLFALVMLVALGSCRNTSRPSEKVGLDEAKLISIEHNNDYTKVEITNPWDTTTLLHTYILVPRNTELPKRPALISLPT